jgi:hypothetical protein
VASPILGAVAAGLAQPREGATVRVALPFAGLRLELARPT